MQNQQNNGPADFINMRHSFNVAGFAAVCLATTITPFFRRNFGGEALGFQGLFAFLLLLFLALGDPAGFCYFLVWLLVLAVRRWETTWRWMRGYVTHSQYSGDSWLAWGCSNEFAKRFLEPPLAFICAVAMCQFSELMGAFLMVGAIALIAVQVIEFSVLRTRVQQMQDSVIEGQFYSSRFRGR